jgi:hypothetical protein
MPGARAGGLGSVRVEAIGFRHREQIDARALTSLLHPGQEIEAISVQALSCRCPTADFKPFSTKEVRLQLAGTMRAAELRFHAMHD